MNTLEFNPRLSPAQVPAKRAHALSSCLCPKCGGRLVENSRACLHCGESLPPAVVASLSTDDGSTLMLAAFMCLMIVAGTAFVLLG